MELYNIAIISFKVVNIYCELNEISADLLISSSLQYIITKKKKEEMQKTGSNIIEKSQKKAFYCFRDLYRNE